MYILHLLVTGVMCICLKSFSAGLEGASVLEIGCGTGLWTRELLSLKCRLTAVDISGDLLKHAKKNAGGGIEFIEGDAENLPFPDGSFDFACGLSILHHLELPRALSEVFRALKPGGKIWFSEPNMMNPHVALQKNIPFLKRLSGDTPSETAFFRRPLHKIVVRAGFEDVEVKPFDFLYPWLPDFLVPPADIVGKRLEQIPVLKEISGSLIIHAKKPVKI